MKTPAGMGRPTGVIGRNYTREFLPTILPLPKGVVK